MTKEEKIKAIYKEIADTNNIFSEVHWFYIEEQNPVMIWDVLDYLNKNFDEWNSLNIKVNFLLSYWKYIRKPFEEQSEECIDYVFNLLPKE